MFKLTNERTKERTDGRNEKNYIPLDTLRMLGIKYETRLADFIG